MRAHCGRRGGGGLLLIGPPGVGKTTLLRDVAHMLAEAMDREVVIVDTRWVGQGGRPPGWCTAAPAAAAAAAHLLADCMPIVVFFTNANLCGLSIAIQPSCT